MRSHNVYLSLFFVYDRENVEQHQLLSEHCSTYYAVIAATDGGVLFFSNSAFSPRYSTTSLVNIIDRPVEHVLDMMGRRLTLSVA